MQSELVHGSVVVASQWRKFLKLLSYGVKILGIQEMESCQTHRCGLVPFLSRGVWCMVQQHTGTNKIGGVSP